MQFNRSAYEGNPAFAAVNFDNVNFNSILLNTDSYKVGMWKQYPPGVTNVYSYIESRGGLHDEIVVAGIQPFIFEYLAKPFTLDDIYFADAFWRLHGEEFPLIKILDMYEAYDGYWPVEINSVLDGTVVPVKNAVAVVEATDPRFAFATTWIETSFLRAVWYSSTVATNSREVKKIIAEYLNKSGDISGLDYKLHDFGARGASSFETAGLGAMAHALNFKGSDTATANIFASAYYGEKDHIVGSITATEHSTITSWGRENEFEAYLHLVESARDNSTFACVSDSYDIYAACAMWNALAGKIKVKGCTLVVRPDSGDPLEVLPKILEILSEGFGLYKNDKGYLMLNNCRIIWGDGITQLTIQSILRTLVDLHGWSADMFAFGQGGALLQAVTRDDQKFAMKCSWVYVHGQGREVFKDPITDPGKTSKKGRVTLVQREDGSYYTGEEDWVKSALKCVYMDGAVLNTTTFADARERAAI